MAIIVIKSKETRVVTYTCRYSTGHLISIIQSFQDESTQKQPNCKKKAAHAKKKV